MKNRLVTAASATALSIALMAGGAFAQDLGLKQLQDQATTTFAQLSLDTSKIDQLTLDELTRIQSVSVSSGTPDTKVQRIETILREADERIAAGGAVTPSGPAGDITADDLEGDMVVKANVGAFLAQLGIAGDYDVEALSTDQLLQIQSIQGSNDDASVQRTRVEELLSN